MLLKAIEEKRFFPFGGDKEVWPATSAASPDGPAICGNGLPRAFREDLYARIKTSDLRPAGPGQPPAEDIEPNLDFELQRFAEETPASAFQMSKPSAGYLASRCRSKRAGRAISASFPLQ